MCNAYRSNKVAAESMSTHTVAITEHTKLDDIIVSLINTCYRDDYGKYNMWRKP